MTEYRGNDRLGVAVNAFFRAETVTMTGFSGQQVKLRLPYVVDELCNGCGIC
jgi:hypothetical protein